MHVRVLLACSTAGLKAAGGGGDPHFNRWGQDCSSFHGECDLLMVSNKDFHKGPTRLDLHVRTTIQDYFSYIETPALRVGENTVQVYKDHLLVNGVYL